MVLVSIIIQYFWFINNSLFNQKETYLSLFTLLTVWALWLLDDWINVKWNWRTKWMSARFKLLWLIIFALLWALWFYYKLDWESRDLSLIIADLHLWIWFIPFFVLVIVSSANSVNITDWLDWLAWGLFNLCLHNIFSRIILAFHTLHNDNLSNNCIFMVQCKTCKILYVRCLKFSSLSKSLNNGNDYKYSSYFIYCLSNIYLWDFISYNSTYKQKT